MLDAIKSAIYEFFAVLAYSTRMQVALWITAFSPLVVLLGGFFLPAPVGSGPFDLILITVREQILSALPWVSGFVFLRCLWMLLEIYQRERERERDRLESL